MGVEPNSDRIWNAIGGVMVAGLIIGALVLIVGKVGPDGSGGKGLMSNLSEKLNSFINEGFSMPSRP